MSCDYDYSTVVEPFDMKAEFEKTEPEKVELEPFAPKPLRIFSDSELAFFCQSRDDWGKA